MTLSLEQRVAILEKQVAELHGNDWFPPPGPHHFSTGSLVNMRGVHPNLVACAFYALRTCPYDFGIPDTGGVRSRQTQQELVDAGASRTMNSRHRYGLALDFYAYVGGKASWAPEHVMPIHDAFMGAASALHLPGVSIGGRVVRLRWGGDWDMDGVREYRENDLVHHEIPAAVVGNTDPHVYAPRVKAFLTNIGMVDGGEGNR